LNKEELKKQISEIYIHYEEEKHKSGDNFNVFEILDIQNKELIHSRFIAFLLNPEEQHGCGSIFLDYFIQKLNNKIVGDGLRIPRILDEYNKAEPEKESKRGRVDIFINNKNSDKHIILEWKINESRGIMQNGWGFYFYKEKWKDDDIEIGFYFKKKNLEDCNFGLRKNSVWYCCDKLVEYSNWGEETFKEFMSDNIEETEFYKCIKKRVIEMCQRIDNGIL
jgi:hypothetical protein